MGEEELRGREQPDGTMMALNALSALGKEIRIDPVDAQDPDHVADVLLDHGASIGASKLLYLLFPRLLVPCLHSRFDSLRDRRSAGGDFRFRALPRTVVRVERMERSWCASRAARSSALESGSARQPGIVEAGASWMPQTLARSLEEVLP